MHADRDDDSALRRALVPSAAGRSLWRAAVWTGAGAAFVGATVAIVVVAVCWLPVSGTDGRAHATIHAGLLAFLASVHGGITIGGVSTSFLPLGMLVAVGLTAWRAGAGLGDVATELGEDEPVRLGLAAGAQALSFAAVCAAAVPFASLGSSDAPILTVAAAAFLLFAVAGGTAFLRSSALGPWCARRLPGILLNAARPAAAGLAVYLASGALLVAGSLAVHHQRVQMLSAQVGGGWGGVPVLLLGVLAAPNAVVAGASYLAGPGFALGSGTSVNAFSTAHGTVPAFPLLGALPEGHGADPLTWLLVVLTPLCAGLTVARLVVGAPRWVLRLRDAGTAALLGGVAMAVLAWQAGGGVGDGRLRTVGASPVRLALAVAVEVAVVAGLGLCAASARQWWLGRRDRGPGLLAVVTGGKGDGGPTQNAGGSAETTAGPADVEAAGDPDEPGDPNEPGDPGEPGDPEGADELAG
jgi:hypothetical protein